MWIRVSSWKRAKFRTKIAININFSKRNYGLLMVIAVQLNCCMKNEQKKFHCVTYASSMLCKRKKKKALPFCHLVNLTKAIFFFNEVKKSFRTWRVRSYDDATQSNRSFRKREFRKILSNRPSFTWKEMI